MTVSLWLVGLFLLSCPSILNAEPVLSTTQRAKMVELRDKARADWRESQVHKNEADYGPIFLFLALNDPDPVAVNRWLLLADGVYSPKPEATRSRELLKIDDDFRSVALWASRHKDDNIRNSAMRMLSSCLGNPDPQAQQRAIECAQRDTNPAVRQGAIQAFWFPVNFQPEVDGAVAECLLQCLRERHAYPLTSAVELCHRTYRKKRRFPASLEARLENQLRQLLSHSEPVVCGRALQALSLFQRSKREGVDNWLYPLLQHRHPLVRGCALHSLGDGGDPRSLKRLLVLVDDTNMAVSDLPCPDVGTGIQVKSICTPANRICSVQEWALEAIQQCSARTAHPFQFTASGRKSSGEHEVTLRVGHTDITAGQQARLALKVKEVKQWWADHGAALGPQD